MGEAAAAAASANPRLFDGDDAARWMRLHLGRGEVDNILGWSRKRLCARCTSHCFRPQCTALDNYFLAYGMAGNARVPNKPPLLMHEGGEFGVSTIHPRSPAQDRCGRLCQSGQRRGGKVGQLRAARYRHRTDAARLVELSASRRPGSGQHQGLSEAVFREGADASSATTLSGRILNPGNGVVDVARVGGQLALTVREGWLYDADLEPTGANCYRSHARYKGMQALGRQLNLRMPFWKTTTASSWSRRVSANSASSTFRCAEPGGAPSTPAPSASHPEGCATSV